MTSFFIKKLQFIPFQIRCHLEYGGLSPYRLAKASLGAASKESYTYGETPLKIWDLIGSHLKPRMGFLDLGCGRGVGLFYLSQAFKARCIGVDAVRVFIDLGNKLAQDAALDVTFINQDLTTYVLTEVDAIFIASTCLEASLLQRLGRECQRIKPKFIFTLSEPLKLYGYTLEEKEIRMPWGRTSLFIHQIK